LAGVKDLTWESAIQSLIKAYRQCLNENNRSPQY
jgi:hypothetical protein